MDLDSQLVREALQARLLVELMGNSMHKELVLKGGLAMRAVHGSVRHTKDIDLDADAKHSRNRVHGIVVRSIQNALESGLITDAHVTEPKQTDTTMRWKIAGTVAGTETPLNLTVEVSRRAALVEEHVVEIELPKEFVGAEAGARVRVLDSQALAVTKVLALTDPKRMAPRDLYDLHVLIQADVEPPIELLAGLPPERLEMALQELWPKVESMTYNLFVTEVLPVMPEVYSKAFTRSQFEDMQLTVATRVQKWLEDARVLQAGGPPSLGGSALGVAATPATESSGAAARPRLAKP